MSRKTDLQLLQFLLAHEHDKNCYSTWREDCGEHHAHDDACLTHRRLRCSFDADRSRLVQQMAPALVLVALRAWAVVGGHADTPCDDSDIPRLAEALHRLGAP